MKEQRECTGEDNIVDGWVRLRIDDLAQRGRAIRIAVADGGIAQGLPDHTLLVRQSRIDKIARAGVVFEIPDVSPPEAAEK